MAIEVVCRCGGRFQTDDENAGRRVSCPACGSSLMVPRAKGEPEFVYDDAPILSISSHRAMVCLILGASSLLLSVLTAIPAFVLGVGAVREIRRARGRITGGWMAGLGIALAIVGGVVIPIRVIVPLGWSIFKSHQVSTCRDNVDRIGAALCSTYADLEDRMFMLRTWSHASLHLSSKFRPTIGARNRPNLSWRVAILPALGPEGEALFRRFHLDEPWDSPHNLTLLKEMPEVYLCPADGGKFPTSTRYQLILGVPRPPRAPSTSAGTSNMSRAVAFLAECETPVPWTSPRDNVFNPKLPAFGLGSAHEDVLHILMDNGRVEAHPRDPDVEALRETITGQDPAPDPEAAKAAGKPLDPPKTPE